MLRCILALSFLVLGLLSLRPAPRRLLAVLAGFVLAEKVAIDRLTVTWFRSPRRRLSFLVRLLLFFGFMPFCDSLLYRVLFLLSLSVVRVP